MSGSRMLQSTAPDTAVEIGATHVAAARLAFRGASPTLAAHAVERLPAGAVVPALAAPNIADPAAVGEAVRQVLGRLGGHARRVALVVPDTVAKVSLLRFDKIPPRAEDLMELVRWQVRKSAPFPLDQAVVSYTPGVRPADGGQEFVVSVARADIVAQYEAACDRAGVHAGLVDLATFSIVNGVIGSAQAPAGDWLLVHARPTYTTLVVLRDADVLFFRNRGEDTEGTLADVVHQTAMYYEDRLKGPGFSRVFLAGGALVPGGADGLRRSLEERLGIAVEPADPRQAAAFTDRIDAAPDLLDALSPLVGILLRERKAA